MLKLDGRIVSGRGSATVALAMQQAYFLHLLPMLSDYHLATINIKLDEALFVSEWNLESPAIFWFKPNPSFKEKFSFMHVDLVYNGNQISDAILYHPHKSPHRENPYVIELIAPYLQLESDRCQVIFRRTPHKEVLNVI